ncbi:hypothetical protein SAMN04488540_12331 [Ferrimonas sediminum]|uniref:Phage integrase family protein n=1 Tax=Ferrimonas sediminum TaxID=718193 RepID=A0A1G9AGD0_9GAMM|nr:hypothetical protein [Ferrimonas sediminum]SDK26331.1 hypothetical protein SAMN04488540_12331 [Ferrimonas sediminum]
MSQNYADGTSTQISENDLLDFLDSSIYPKPRWMMNDSIYDNEWMMAKSGFDSPTIINSKTCNKLSFKKLISPGEYLTDKVNEPLLTDIRNSLLYLDITERITRPKRITEILATATKLILHANEIRHADGKPPVRTLQLIKFDDIKDYLLSFGVDKETFNYTLETIIERWDSPEKINWNLIKFEFCTDTRKFATLKHKIKTYLKAHNEILSRASHYKLEYPNANIRKFDIDTDLCPAENTISNEISKLEALYTARPAQKYMFQHSAISQFSNGHAIFSKMMSSKKTQTMPVNVALYTLSSALNFARAYGPSLREYVVALSKSEKDSINDLNIQPSRVQRNTSEIKKYAFENTEIPNHLEKLNITSWEGEGFEKIEHAKLRKGLSVGAAILLYIASMWILLASFGAGRLTSLITLKRSCFQQSPIDGLFDIVMRIPKSSERFELEDVHRPIPDLIYDYGLEFASFVCELEERQGYFANEDEVFLFSRILSLHSYDAFTHSSYDRSEDPIYRYPLSGDTIYKAICFFQDWSESPLIDGKRWYPSNHQFRRLFAVLYFNFSDEVGLEELSWFMGHSDLEQTFHYAEVAPTDEWIDEAEAAIARAGALLNKVIHGDDIVNDIVNKARKVTSICLVLEPLIRTMISEHKSQTGQEVRFYKIEGKEVFFYFCKPEEE